MRTRKQNTPEQGYVIIQETTRADLLDFENILPPESGSRWYRYKLLRIWIRNNAGSNFSTTAHPHHCMSVASWSGSHSSQPAVCPMESYHWWWSWSLPLVLINKPNTYKKNLPVQYLNNAGCTAAVDVYCWLHRAAFGCAEQLVQGRPTDAYIKYVMKVRLDSWRQFFYTLIFSMFYSHKTHLRPVYLLRDIRVRRTQERILKEQGFIQRSEPHAHPPPPFK